MSASLRLICFSLAFVLGTSARAAVRPFAQPSMADLARSLLVYEQKSGDEARLQAVTGWLRQNTDKAAPQVLLAQAAVARQQLDFELALTLVQRYLEQVPADGAATLARAQLLISMGRYAEARDACRRLAPSVSATARLACSSIWTAASGRGGRVLARLHVTATIFGGRDPQAGAWALGVLAESEARLGRGAAALTTYRHAIDLANAVVGDIGLSVRAADLAMDLGRPQEVLTLFSPSESLAVRLRLARAAVDLHASEAPALIASVRRDLLRQPASPRQRRDLAYAAVYLGRGGDADRTLQLARDNFIAHRESLDARLLLIAAVQANAGEAAKPAIDWLGSTAKRDPQFSELLGKLRYTR